MTLQPARQDREFDSSLVTPLIYRNSEMSMPAHPTLDDLEESAGIAGSPYYTYAHRSNALKTYDKILKSLLEDAMSVEFDAIAEAVGVHIKQFMTVIEDRSEFRDFREDLIWDGVFSALDTLTDKAIAVDNARAPLLSASVRFTLAAREESTVPPWRTVVSRNIDCPELLERFYSIADHFFDIAQVRMAAIQAYDEIAAITMGDLLQPIDQTQANELFLHIARQAHDEPELQACALKYGVAGIRNPERHL